MKAFLIALIFTLLSPTSALASFVIPDASVGPVKLTNGGVFSVSGTANLGLAASVTSNILTVSLKQADGTSDPAARTGAVGVSFRSTTANTGGYTLKSFVAATSISLAANDSIGVTAAVNGLLYVYLIADTTSEICLSTTFFSEQSVQSASALTAGADTDGTKLWCTNAHTSKPIRKIGHVTSVWSSPNWGAPGVVAVNGNMAQTRTILSTGTAATYTTPLGATSLRVIAVGGGGGGSGSGSGVATCGEGGGSGGLIDTVINAPAASYTYTIGAAGAAGNSGSGAGGAGGDTSFGSNVAGGGGGGQTPGNGPGSGGTSSLANGVGIAVKGNAGSVQNPSGRPGSGGGSFFGGGAYTSSGDTGGGGGGSIYGTHPGNAGGAGLIIIYETY